MATPKKTDEHFLDLRFPLLGLDISQKTSEQPPGTTAVGQNVRAFEMLTLRGRGGQRAGIQQHIPQQVSGHHSIQMLNTIVTVSADALASNFSPVNFDGFGTLGVDQGPGVIGGDATTFSVDQLPINSGIGYPGFDNSDTKAVVIVVGGTALRDATHHRRWNLYVNNHFVELYDPDTTPSLGKFYTTQGALTMQGTYLLNGNEMPLLADFVDSHTLSKSLFRQGSNHVVWTTADPYDSVSNGMIIHLVDKITGNIIQTVWGDNLHIADRTFFTNNGPIDEFGDMVGVHAIFQLP